MNDLYNIIFKRKSFRKFNDALTLSIFDDFPKSRITDGSVFKKVGFKRVSEDIVELTKQDYFTTKNSN